MAPAARALPRPRSNCAVAPPAVRPERAAGLAKVLGYRPVKATSQLSLALCLVPPYAPPDAGVSTTKLNRKLKNKSVIENLAPIARIPTGPAGKLPIAMAAAPPSADRQVRAPAGRAEFSLSRAMTRERTEIALRLTKRREMNGWSAEIDNQLQSYELRIKEEINPMSKTLPVALSAALLGSFMSVSAWAFPAAPVDSNAASDVILAAQGCGPGFHRGPYGRCRPNARPRRVCPFGWHYSVYRRRCVRN